MKTTQKPALISDIKIEAFHFPNTPESRDMAGKVVYSLQWYAVSPRGRKKKLYAGGFWSYKTYNVHPLFETTAHGLAISIPDYKRIVEAAKVVSIIDHKAVQAHADEAREAKRIVAAWSECDAAKDLQYIHPIVKQGVDSGAFFTKIVIVD